MSSGSPHRLYVKGKHLSYKRGKRNTDPNTSLIKIGTKLSDSPKPPAPSFFDYPDWRENGTIQEQRANVNSESTEGVDTTEDAQFYLGKRVAYVYRTKKLIRGSKIRVIWGKITRPHGNNGVVRSKFRNNLPPSSFGATLRIMLYPSNI
ncbi:hypothetical protein H072_1346 [Dactylellina haptotyla CBS 200.50]|uniref:60S ribosomal protein L33-A n=1 Tax=Dactylellina haptotyla (strain CBS 200.50) TaxID=1284197 RepID=S8ANZ6_DACHA|nr:hypothetical protein H072_1346 [Dactylellina haptotyla CBS 200.50]